MPSPHTHTYEVAHGQGRVKSFAKVAAGMVPLGIHLAFSVVISTVERESAARGVVCEPDVPA
jgi:hypothetical protein